MADTPRRRYSDIRFTPESYSETDGGTFALREQPREFICCTPEEEPMAPFSTGSPIRTKLHLSIALLALYVAGGVAIVTTVTANLGIVLLAAVLGGIGLLGFLGMLFAA